MSDELRIESIEWEIMSNGRGNEPLWFHPRACRIPGNDGETIFLTAQGISGSDYFHPVHWMTTDDRGGSWSTPQPIPGFDRKDAGNGTQEGVCDVVPEYHERTGRVIAIGHTVFYRDGSFFKEQPKRMPVYGVWSEGRDERGGGDGTGGPTGGWTARRNLEWDAGIELTMHTPGCGQRHTFEDGSVLIPLAFRERGRDDARVTSVVASFDGESLSIEKSGAVLENRVKRGLLEPTIARLDDRFFISIRAEDDRGYLSRSSDGLSWEQIKPWTWDDGEPLTMSTTQQRWLLHSDGLYLVYTRKAESNRNVMRWRAPLFVAQFDPERMCLIRESEQIAVLLRGDGVNGPDQVARLGNFHTVAVTPEESWVTVGESIPAENYKGDTIISRIRWSKPNRLVL